MARLLFEYDAERRLRIDYEETADGSILLHYTQDVEPILDANRSKRSLGKQWFASDPDMWKVASIPIVVQYEWARRYGVHDVTDPQYGDLMQRLLNDPEWRYLKTAEIII